jgi:hypothetical protein
MEGISPEISPKGFLSLDQQLSEISPGRHLHVEYSIVQVMGNKKIPPTIAENTPGKQMTGLFGWM